MNIFFRVLARINFEIWATISFTCGMLGIPAGRTRDAIEYVARVGTTTLFDTAFFACTFGAIFAFALSFSSLHAAWNVWRLMFTPPLLEIFGAFSLILTLSVMHRPSKRYQQQHDA